MFLPVGKETSCLGALGRGRRAPPPDRSEDSIATRRATRPKENVDKKEKQQHFYDHIDPAYNTPFKNLNLAKCILSYRRMYGKRFPIVRSLQSITHISAEA